MGKMNKKNLVTKADKLATTKTSAKQTITSQITAATQQLNEKYPIIEQQGWNTKLAEAHLIVAGERSAVKYPMIAAEILISRKKPKDVADKVITKATKYNKIIGTLSGIKQKAFADIEKAKTATTIDKAVANAQKELERAV